MSWLYRLFFFFSSACSSLEIIIQNGILKQRDRRYHLPGLKAYTVWDVTYLSCSVTKSCENMGAAGEKCAPQTPHTQRIYCKVVIKLYKHGIQPYYIWVLHKMLSKESGSLWGEGCIHYKWLMLRGIEIQWSKKMLVRLLFFSFQWGSVKAHFCWNWGIWELLNQNLLQSLNI